MKYLKQFGIIISISFVGEVLNAVIPLPIPASIYGLVIMFACLAGGVFKPEAVQETGAFLIDIMPVMFIPATVGLMAQWDVIRPLLLPYAVITLVSTVIVLVVAGRTTQAIIGLERKAGR